MTLQGKTIAILIAPRGTEESEFVEPKAAVEKAGASVKVIGLEAGQAETNTSDLDPGSSQRVDLSIDQASAASFDGLIVPGGTVGSDKLRASGPVVDFVRSFFEQGKPVGAICHGPWLLVEADVVEGRTLTSFPSVRTDIENAGGAWVDKEVVVDEGLVTSRTPKDLTAFCAKLVEEFAEGQHDGQRRSA
ncbi:type 1 glutamine amidotransferase domain-containing protein [Enterovirga rhinocerotis]|uniref:Protease I n=1 Tax=Enterovirga rhinocerotis TaxID=1339210 RepID=A0A4R7C0I8_9HYPH|nr:type 1 glutamine amidotransferase domain-containing protein [Enterovirga rhinocerotis]TDR89997.1 protease I [Enterovirga rhinocerotis]